MNRILMKWVVDECPDAYGNWVIRIDNGTPNGDTDMEPIATVYGLALANSIMEDHNARLPFYT